MRVLVAGASGVIGQRLVRILAASGHMVTGTTRSPARAAAIHAAGARPLVVDVFDGQRLGESLSAARPEVVVHQLTDLPDRLEPAGLAEMAVRNARIRTEGTRHLVAAALRAGARRLIAQSIAWAYTPGREPHPEDDPLDVDAEGNRRVTVQGVAELERLVTSVPRSTGSSSATGSSTVPAPGTRGRPGTCRCTCVPPLARPRWPSRAASPGSTTSWRTARPRRTRRRAPASAGTWAEVGRLGAASKAGERDMNRCYHGWP